MILIHSQQIKDVVKEQVIPGYCNFEKTQLIKSIIVPLPTKIKLFNLEEIRYKYILPESIYSRWDYSKDDMEELEDYEIENGFVWLDDCIIYDLNLTTGDELEFEIEWYY